MNILHTLHPGVVLKGGPAAPLATRDQRWLYEEVELIETALCIDEEGTGNPISRTFLAIGRHGIGTQHVLRVYITFDGEVELTRVKGTLL